MELERSSSDSMSGLDFCRAQFRKLIMGSLPMNLDEKLPSSGHGGPDHASDRRISDRRSGSDGHAWPRLRHLMQPNIVKKRNTTAFAGQAGPRVPPSELRHSPFDRYRATRGQDGWLSLARFWRKMQLVGPVRPPTTSRPARTATGGAIQPTPRVVELGLTCNWPATKMAPDMEILVVLTTMPKAEYGPKMLFSQEVTAVASFPSFEIVGVPTRR